MSPRGSELEISSSRHGVINDRLIKRIVLTHAMRRPFEFVQFSNCVFESRTRDFRALSICLDCRGFLLGETGFNVSRCHAPISRPGIVIALTRVKGGTTGFYCDSDSERRSNFETNWRTERQEIAKFFFQGIVDPFSSIVSFYKIFFQNLNQEIYFFKNVDFLRSFTFWVMDSMKYSHQI